MSVRSEDHQLDTLQLSDLERSGEQIPGGFFVYRADESQEILYANGNLLRIFGCATQEEFMELTGCAFCGLVHPSDYEAVQRSISEQIADDANDNLDSVEYRIIRRDGEIRWVDDYGHLACLDGFGDVYCVFISDITERHRAQEERFRAELAFEEEKRANEIKSALLTGLSNEIRTPMKVIAEATELARAHVDEPRRLLTDLKSLDDARQRLQQLADDLLDISSNGFGRIAIHREPVALAGQMLYLLELFRPEAELRGIALTEDLSLPDEEVLADAQRLRDALNTLLSSAAGRMPESGGSIAFTARRKPSSETGCVCYEFTVADNGGPLPEDVLSQLQAAAETAEDAHGVVLARKLLAMMGGTLSARSGEGGGTVVTVDLPLQLAEHNRGMQLVSLFDLFSLLSENDPVCLYDLRMQTARFSPSLLSIIGLPEDERSDANGLYFWADYIHPDDRERFLQTLQDACELRIVSFDLQCRMRIKSGAYYPVRFLGSATMDPDGRPDFLGMRMRNEDISAHADPVTGLPNQHRFLQALQQPYGSQAAMLIRLGRLEKVNEVYGFSCGNEVLRSAATLISKLIDGRGTLYRMHGAQFAVLTSSMDERQLSQLYDVIRDELSGSIVTDGVPHRLVAFGGLLLRSDERELTETEALENLTGACNESERAQHGGLVTIRESGEQGADTPAVTRAIRQCMAHDFDSFFLLYQPVFSPGTQKPIGAEALLRWRSEEFGELRPSRFLPDIEHESRFRDLGYWILRSAMTDGVRFLEAQPEFTLCVNVSPRQVSDPYFAEHLAAISQEVRFPLDHLQLEMNRECQLMSAEMLRLFAEPMHMLGVRIGVDDFGSGGGWLDALKSSNADYVKFSAEFTHSLSKGEADREALHHLSELAGAYQASVYFKAVESEDTALALAELTVSGAQGWFFSEAVYFDEILAWLGMPENE